MALLLSYIHNIVAIISYTELNKLKNIMAREARFQEILWNIIIITEPRS